MKFLEKYKIWLAVLALPLLMVMCMTIEEIIHPDNAQVDSEITIQVKLKFVAETERTSKLAFGVLAPKSWNIAGNAKLTLTTTSADLPVNLVTDDPLTVIPANQMNPSTMTPWPASFQSRFGLQGNYGPMEWVVFESNKEFTADGSSGGANAKIDGVVTIKLTTGPENMKVNMAYSYCGKSFGFSASGEEYPDTDVIASKVLEVSGAAGPVNDYTTVSLISTTPQSFGYGDIFAINFVEETESTVTPLKGADKVYLWGKVIYDNGQEKIMDAVNAKTLMEKVGDGAWQRYVYLRDFFDLPAGADITATYFHFSNESKTIIVRNAEDEDFMIVEAADE